MIVFMKPIDAINNNPARSIKVVTFRPLPESGVREMGNWIVSHDWGKIYRANTAHEKAEILQKTLLQKMDYFYLRKL